MKNSLALVTRRTNGILVLCKRWMLRKPAPSGKPPVLPPSKTVLYRIPKGEWVEPEYVEELLWRRHVYNNAMVSIRKHFQAEVRAQEAAGLGIEELKKREMEELNELILLNEKKNEKSAEERAVRERKEMEDVKKDVLAEIDKTLEAERAHIDKRTEEVLQAIGESKDFITAETLRSKIEEALENPVVFDYAIDLAGQRIYAKEPVKYFEGTPTRQKGRLYDRSHGSTFVKKQ